ncbi:MAG TPA: hypothetical protein H9844_00500 [Candidatus Evtepia faecigallinarum]|nr:hypothetical protein [Candidatus Evtepia faecigallinarum]
MAKTVGKAKEKIPLSKGEKRRLRQLVICLVLFAAVFAGRGMDLGPVSRLSAVVGDLVGRDTDFQAVFAQVGESFSKGEPAVETFRSLWSEAFAPQEADKEEPAEETPAQRPAADNQTDQETQPEGGEESGQTSP